MREVNEFVINFIGWMIEGENKNENGEIMGYYPSQRS